MRTRAQPESRTVYGVWSTGRDTRMRTTQACVGREGRTSEKLRARMDGRGSWSSEAPFIKTGHACGRANAKRTSPHQSHSPWRRRQLPRTCSRVVPNSCARHHLIRLTTFAPPSAFGRLATRRRGLVAASFLPLAVRPFPRSVLLLSASALCFCAVPLLCSSSLPPAPTPIRRFNAATPSHPPVFVSSLSLSLSPSARPLHTCGQAHSLTHAPSSRPPSLLLACHPTHVHLACIFGPSRHVCG